MIGACLLIAFFSLGTGMLMPFFPLWLDARGLSAAEISMILAIPAVIRSGGSPVFSYFGDLFGRRRFIRVIAALNVLLVCLLFVSYDFWPILALAVVIYAGAQSLPIQIDGIIIGLVRRKVVRSYGSIKAFGSTAYVGASLLAVPVLSWLGPDGVLIWYLLTLGCLALASTQISPGLTGRDAGQDGARRASVWLQPRLVIVIAAGALVQGTHNGFIAFGAIQMTELGFPNAVIALAIAAGSGSEVLMFAFSYLLIDRLTPIRWIAVGAVAALLRWTAMAWVEMPVLMVGLQLLHALSFGATYIGIIGHITAHVEERQIAAAQGMYVTFFGGFAALLTYAMGQIFETWDGMSFLLPALASAVSLGLLAFRRLL
ncbi:MAG: hypothetical protein ABS76_07510 [Pelagibacterium sp. SCN 64-44]|nr:MAG: hypothetical protein ABS76_07510 [Pelagibacterium sp. SCN 64-44]